MALLDKGVLPPMIYI